MEKKIGLMALTYISTLSCGDRTLNPA